MYYFIVNPNARSGKGKSIWRKVCRVMNDKGLVWGTLRKEGAPRLCISNKILLCLKRYSPTAMPFLPLWRLFVSNARGSILPFLREMALG